MSSDKYKIVPAPIFLAFNYKQCAICEKIGDLFEQHHFPNYGIIVSCKSDYCYKSAKASVARYMEQVGIIPCDVIKWNLDRDQLFNVKRKSGVIENDWKPTDFFWSKTDKAYTVRVVQRDRLEKTIILDDFLSVNHDPLPHIDGFEFSEFYSDEWSDKLNTFKNIINRVTL